MGSINNKMFSVPRLVVTIHHIPPTWQYKAGKVGTAIFHPPLMLLFVRTDSFNLHRRTPGLLSHIKPRITGEGYGVDRIGHNGGAKSKVLRSGEIGGTVSGILIFSPLRPSSQQ